MLVLSKSISGMIAINGVTLPNHEEGFTNIATVSRQTYVMKIVPCCSSAEQLANLCRTVSAFHKLA